MPVPSNGHGLTAAEATHALLTAVGRQIEKPEFTLTNGVVLRTKAIAKESIRRVFLQIKDPVVPVVMIASKGREEANPFDPDYIAAKQQANVQRLNAVTRALHMLGLELVSVPEGMPGPDDDSWIEELRAAGVEDLHPENASMRWLEWLEMIALATDLDQATAFTEAAKTYGLFESEVFEAVASFRRQALRGSDSGRGTERDGADGDPSGRDDAGPVSPGVRGTPSRAKQRRRVAGLGEPTEG